MRRCILGSFYSVRWTLFSWIGRVSRYLGLVSFGKCIMVMSHFLSEVLLVSVYALSSNSYQCFRFLEFFCASSKLAWI